MKKVINESNIRRIVSESLKEILSESLINEFLSSFGTKGRLDPSMLDKPQDLFSKEYQLMDSIFTNGRPNRNIDIPTEFGNTLAYNIWKQYVVAMLGSFNVDANHRPIPTVKTRKGVDYPKKARGFFGWLDDIRKGKINKILADGKYPILAYKSGNSFLFGHYIEGYFVACYVSPFGREIFQLIGDLCQYENVIFMVTLDMASILERAGLLTDGKEYPTPYNGRTVMKKIFGTSQEALDFAIMMEHGSSIMPQLKALGIDKSKVNKIRSKTGNGNLADILKIASKLKNGGSI